MNTITTEHTPKDLSEHFVMVTSYRLLEWGDMFAEVETELEARVLLDNKCLERLALGMETNLAIQMYREFVRFGTPRETTDIIKRVRLRKNEEVYPK